MGTRTPSRVVYLGALATTLALACNAYPSDSRIVPQPTITGFNPVSVAFHPHAPDVLIVLHHGGKLDLLHIGDPSGTVNTLEIPTAATNVSFGPDGKHAVAGADDGTVRIWNLETGTPASPRLQSHSFGVNNVAFSPDKSSIVSVGADGTLRTRHLKPDGTLVAPFDAGHATSLTEGILPPGTDPQAATTHLAFDQGNNPVVVSVQVDGTAFVAVIDGNEPQPHTIGDQIAEANAAAIAPGGKLVAFVHNDWDQVPEIQVWDLLSTGEPLSSFSAKGFEPETLSFSPDGQRLAAGGSDGTLLLWDIPTGLPLGAPLKGHTSHIVSLDISSDSRHIASADADGKLILWRIVGGAPAGVALKPHDHPAEVVFSSSGRRFVTNDGDSYGVWNVASGIGSWREADTASISVDGSHIAMVDPESRVLSVIDVSTMATTTTIQLPHRALVTATAVTHDGARVAAATLDGYVLVHSGSNLRRLARRSRPEHRISHIAFDPTGSRLVTAGLFESVRLWDFETGELWKLPTPDYVTLDVGFAAGGTLVFADTSTAATNTHHPLGSAHVVRFWRAANDAPKGEHRSFVSPATISPDGNLALSAQRPDGGLLLWDLESNTYQPLGSSWPSAIAFGSDGTRAASGNLDGSVQIWDLATGTPLGLPLLGHIGSVTSIDYSPDGRHVVSSGEDLSVHIWHTESATRMAPPIVGRVDLRTVDPATRRVLNLTQDKLRVWDLTAAIATHEATVDLRGMALLALSYNARRDMAAVLGQREVRLYDLTDPAANPTRLPVDSACEPPDCFSFDPAFAAFDATGAILATSATDGAVRVWDVSTGDLLGLLRRDDSRILALAFNPASSEIATGGSDGVITLWDTSNFDGSPRAQFAALDAPVWSLAVDSSGSAIAAGTADGVVTVWDYVARQSQSSVQAHQEAVLQLAFSPDSAAVLSSGGDGELVVTDYRRGEILTTTSACYAMQLAWLAANVVVNNCIDRLTFFDSQLHKRGELFTPSVGIAATVFPHGVFAAPPTLRGHFSTFDQSSANEGVPPSIPLSTFRSELLADRSAWSAIRDAVSTGVLRTLTAIKELHTFLGSLAVPFWIAVAWLLPTLAACAMWLFWPARLAHWAMPRSGRLSVSEASPVRTVVNVVAVFLWVARTRRPLSKWLARNSHCLESICFTTRQPVVERHDYLSLHHDDDIASFWEKLGANQPAWYWIDGVGGSGKTALAVHLLRTALASRSEKHNDSGAGRRRLGRLPGFPSGAPASPSCLVSRTDTRDDQTAGVNRADLPPGRLPQ